MEETLEKIRLVLFKYFSIGQVASLMKEISDVLNEPDDDSNRVEPPVKVNFAEEEKRLLTALLISKISEYKTAFEDTTHLEEGSVKEYIDRLESLVNKLQ